MTLEFNQQILEKILLCQILQKSVQWKSRRSTWLDGRTDRHDEANICFSQFCETRLKGENRIISYAKGGVWHTSGPPFVIVSYLTRGLQSARTCDKNSLLKFGILADWRISTVTYIQTHTHTHTHTLYKFVASNEGSERFVWCEKL